MFISSKKCIKSVRSFWHTLQPQSSIFSMFFARSSSQHCSISLATRQDCASTGAAFRHFPSLSLHSSAGQDQRQRPYRRWLRRFERPTALRILRARLLMADFKAPRTPSPLISRQPGPVPRMRHRGRSPGGRGACRPTRRSALGAGRRPGGERAACGYALCFAPQRGA